MVMAAQPEPIETGWADGADRHCPECGSPIEEGAARLGPFRVCRSCYDAYVDHAGR
jgi:hypothetical protein